jgi:uncharacterized protein YkwD
VPLRLRRLVLASVLLAVVSACTGPALAPPPAAPPVPSKGAYLVASINSVRAGHGAPAVVRDPFLDVSARHWAKVLVAEGKLRHSNLYEIPLQFTLAGENVAIAGDVASAHQALVQSPSHFANIVNATYNKVGVAVVRHPVSRSLFVVEQFCRC